jgi:sugar phosphate isomerase/epimerase
MLPAHVGCDSTTVRGLVDDFDSPYLGVCFDTGHAHVSDEGVDAAFAILRDRIITFHLADNDGHRDQHSQPPYGTIDWPSFVRAFRSMDFADPVTVEAPPWNRATPSVLLREARALFAGDLLITPLGNRQIRAICQQCGHYLFGTPQDPFCACDP